MHARLNFVHTCHHWKYVVPCVNNQSCARHISDPEHTTVIISGASEVRIAHAVNPCWLSLPSCLQPAIHWKFMNDHAATLFASSQACRSVHDPACCPLSEYSAPCLTKGLLIKTLLKDVSTFVGQQESEWLEPVQNESNNNPKGHWFIVLKHTTGNARPGAATRRRCGAKSVELAAS